MCFIKTVDPLKVSINIPTFRQARVLRRAVGSALEQDYPHVEVNVCDDASPEDVFAGLTDLRDDPRLRLFVNPHRIGRVANYRRLLYEHATGDWALNLDGDDELLDPTYISRAISMVQSESRLVLVFANIVECSEMTGQSIERRNPFTQSVMEGRELFMRLHEPDVGTYHLTCLYDRKKALGLDFYRVPISSSDFESIHRLMLHGRAGFIDCFAGRWWRSERSVTLTATPRDTLGNLRAITGVYEHARSRPDVGPRNAKRWKARMLLQRGRCDLRQMKKQGLHIDRWRYLWRIIRLSPSAGARLALGI